MKKKDLRWLLTSEQAGRLAIAAELRSVRAQLDDTDAQLDRERRLRAALERDLLHPDAPKPALKRSLAHWKKRALHAEWLLRGDPDGEACWRTPTERQPMIPR